MSLEGDLRYTLRTLLRNRVFALVAILSLALGTGANSAIFSVVDAVLLRPVPYQNPERQVMLWQNDKANPGQKLPFAPADYFDYRKQNRTFAGIEGFYPWSFNLTGNGDPERLQGGAVSAGLFPLLGFKPALGRNFLPEEDSPGGPPAVLLSDGLWRRRFGGDQKVPGTRLTLDGKVYTIVGVMPPGLQFPPSKAEIWLPLAEDRQSANRGFQYLRLLARLKPGTTLAAAQTDLSTVASRLEREYPSTNAGRGTEVILLHEQLVGKIRPALIVLFGAVFLLLAVACVNVANLLLVRAAARRGELAIRSALGATRRQLVRQLVTESLFLSFLGAACGLLLAHWGVKLLVALSPQRVYGLDKAGIDARVVAFTVVIATLSAVAFGLVPAFRASRTNVSQALKAADGRLHGTQLSGLLAASEIALTFALLIGASLLIQSFANLRNVDPGFKPKGVLTLEVALPTETYSGLPQTNNFLTEALRRIRSLPGVRSVGTTSTLPLTNGMNIDARFTIEGAPARAPGEHETTYIRPVSADYFRTLGVRLVAGRSLNELDDHSSPPVALVNQTLAKRFKDGQVLDRRLLLDEVDLGDPGKFEAVPRQVVGIVADVKHKGLNQEALPEVYLPVRQGAWRIYSFVIRTAQEPAQLAQSVSRAIWEIDKNLPISGLRTMQEIVDESLAQARFATLLLSAFAIASLLLASIGIYGVVSYSVSLRTREMGLRMALGAQPGDVRRLVIGSSLALSLGGVTVGLCASLALSRLMTSLVFGITPTDPRTFAGVAIVLGAVALLASYRPALRASRVDPMKILRAD